MSAARAGPKAPSLRAQAYENFRQQVVQAQIRPGQFISQRELMQLLGMPLGAVRELIPRLEAEGLLHTVPQRGLQIAHADLRRMREAYELRRLIEREAALRFTASASDGELEQIERAHRSVLDRALQGPIDEALLAEATQVDWGLHERMVDATGNDLMAQTYRINSLRVRLIRFERSSLSAAVLATAMAEHLAFVQAMRRRDATAAVQQLTHHLDCAYQRVLGLPEPPPGAVPDH